MKRILLLTLLAACATRVENVGNTLGNDAVPTEDHAVRWAIGLGEGGDEAAVAARFTPDGDVVAITYSSTQRQDASGVWSIDNISSITKRAGSDGAKIWTRDVAGTGSDGILFNALAIDSDGSSIVAGSYCGSVHLGTTTLHTDTADLVIAKYLGDGDLLWVQPLGAFGVVEPTSIAVDRSGNAFVAGWLTGSVTFLGDTYAGPWPGVFPPTTGEDTDSFVLSYSGDGTPRWFRAVYGAGLSSIAVTEDGQVVLAGTVTGTTELAGTVLSTPSLEAAIAASFTNEGVPLWATFVHATDASSFSYAGPVIAADGQIVVGTHYQANIDDHLDRNSTMTAFDPAGSAVWSQSIPTSSSGGPGPMRGIAALPDGDLVSTRWIDGPYNSDHPDQVAGSLDQVRVASDGTLEAIEHAGHRTMATGLDAVLLAIATGPTGETVQAGQFTGTIDFGVTRLTATPTPADAPTFTSDALIFVVEP